MPGPLHGIRILDLSHVLNGPLACTMLGDQGAEVIKIEAPGRGDTFRAVGSHRSGMSGSFHVANRGKRSIAVDLSQPRGIEIVLELARRADALVQNLRPGVVDRLGIGYEACRKLNPDLVYLSIYGFGPSGPYRDKRVYDNCIQTYAGMTAAQRGPEGEPHFVRQLICDKLTGYAAAQAVTAALFARQRGAGGQHVELSMMDVTAQFLWPDAGGDLILLGEGVSHQPTVGRSFALTRLADGFGTMTMFSDAEFSALCEAMEAPEVAADPRLATVAARMQNLDLLSETLHGTIARKAATLTRAELEERLTRADVPHGIARMLEELHEDPQIVANQTFTVSEHPVCGTLREPRPAPRFHETPARVGGPAPTLGQHTDEILRELGREGEIAGLRAAGIVA